MSWQDRAYNREDREGDRPFSMSGLGGRSITTWLIAICIAVFVIDALTGRMAGRSHAIGNGLLTEWGYFSAGTLQRFQLWRIITFQFLHADILHIAFNMYFLYFFGRIVESALTPLRYLAFYLLCGIGGAALYMGLLVLGDATQATHVPFLLFGNPNTPLVGASAGIFGVMLAAAALAPHQTVSLIIPPITLRLRTLVYILVALAAFFVMVDNQGGEAAHLGGALVGALLIRRPGWLAFAEYPKRFLPQRRKQSRWQRKLKAMRTSEESEQAEVDRILDKVRQHGLHSLSRSEKKALQRATQRQRQTG